MLQFVYHLALAILVGGALVLGSTAAPAIFRTVRSRGEAGAIFGAVLARWDGLAILCVIAVVLTSVLKAGAYEVKDRKSTRLNSSHVSISYAVFCLKKKKITENVKS